jgi:hypothetical protein
MAERGGMLKVFVKGRKKDEPGRWDLLCEFSMTVVSHAMNKIKGRSRCFIFRCVVSTGNESETFYVPLARDDCDEFTHLFDVFKARKKGCGAFIHKDNCNKNSRPINCIRVRVPVDSPILWIDMYIPSADAWHRQRRELCH